MATIDVVVPVYGVEKYLHRCVSSIQAQKMNDYNLILVDDGSKDASARFCDEFALIDNNTVVIHKKNGGLSDARNKGIDFSINCTDSSFISFVDSDDWIHPQYLSLLYSVLVENGADVSACKPIRTECMCQMPAIEKATTTSGNIVTQYESKCFDITCSCGKLYKKKLFCTLRFPYGKLFEDDWIIPMLLFSGISLVSIQEKLYYYFYNANGITGSSWSTEKFSACLEPLKRQIVYMYEHGYYEMIKYRCRVYADVLLGSSQKHQNVYTNKRYMTQQKKLLKKFVLKYKKYIPEIQQYGYDAWLNRKSYIMESFYQDVAEIKKKKGKLYSYVWKAVHYVKIKRQVRIYDT